MQYCPNCGTPCEDDALFCEACGTDLRDDTVLRDELKEVDQIQVSQQVYQEQSYQQDMVSREPQMDKNQQIQKSPAGKNISGKSGKNMTALIVGAAVLVVAIIAGTAFGVHMIKSNGEKAEQETVTSKLSDKEDDEQTVDTENAAEETASGSENQETDTELKPTIAPLEEEPDMDTESSAASAEEDSESDSATVASGQKADTELKPTIAPLEEEPVSEVQDQYETYYVVNCKESITLRKSASTKAGEYCQIPLGAAVSFVEKAENGFYKVIYNGTTGYALASYLSPEQGGSSEEGSRMVVVNCKESITLRKIPSTKGEEFCQIPLGAEVEYLGTAENGFYTVKYNGFTGYALASYLAWAS